MDKSSLHHICGKDGRKGGGAVTNVHPKYWISPLSSRLFLVTLGESLFLCLSCLEGGNGLMASKEVISGFNHTWWLLPNIQPSVFRESLRETSGIWVAEFSGSECKMHDLGPFQSWFKHRHESEFHWSLWWMIYSSKLQYTLSGLLSSIWDPHSWHQLDHYKI